MRGLLGCCCAWGFSRRQRFFRFSEISLISGPPVAQGSRMAACVPVCLFHRLPCGDLCTRLAGRRGPRATGDAHSAQQADRAFRRFDIISSKMRRNYVVTIGFKMLRLHVCIYTSLLLLLTVHRYNSSTSSLSLSRSLSLYATRRDACIRVRVPVSHVCMNVSSSSINSRKKQQQQQHISSSSSSSKQGSIFLATDCCFQLPWPSLYLTYYRAAKHALCSPQNPEPSTRLVYWWLVDKGDARQQLIYCRPVTNGRPEEPNA